MKKDLFQLTRTNVKLAKQKWPEPTNKYQLEALRSLTEDYGFAIALGDLTLLDGRWYVTHAGLLRLAARRHCQGIRVQKVGPFCDPGANHWVFKAIVYKSSGSKGFVGHRGGDPSKVSVLG